MRTTTGSMGRDLEAFEILMKETLSLVSERLPGTERYDCYLDKDASRSRSTRNIQAMKPSAGTWRS